MKSIKSRSRTIGEVLRCLGAPQNSIQSVRQGRRTWWAPEEGGRLEAAVEGGNLLVVTFFAPDSIRGITSSFPLPPAQGMWYLNNADEGYPSFATREGAEEAAQQLGGEVWFSPY